MKAFLLITTFTCVFLMAVMTVAGTTKAIPPSTALLACIGLGIVVYSNIQCITEIENETKN